MACGDGSVAMLALDEKAGLPAPHRAAWALTAAAGGHAGSACVAVRFPAFAGAAPLLLSGGIDGRLLLWHWGEYVSGAMPAPMMAAQATHGAKVNWLATAGGVGDGDEGGGGSSGGGGGRVYVADTSHRLAEYAVRP